MKNKIFYAMVILLCIAVLFGCGVATDYAVGSGKAQNPTYTTPLVEEAIDGNTLEVKPGVEETVAGEPEIAEPVVEAPAAVYIQPEPNSITVELKRGTSLDVGALFTEKAFTFEHFQWDNIQELQYEAPKYRMERQLLLYFNGTIAYMNTPLMA